MGRINEQRNQETNSVQGNSANECSHPFQSSHPQLNDELSQMTCDIYDIKQKLKISDPHYQHILSSAEWLSILRQMQYIWYRTKVKKLCSTSDESINFTRLSEMYLTSNRNGAILRWTWRSKCNSDLAEVSSSHLKKWSISWTMLLDFLGLNDDAENTSPLNSAERRQTFVFIFIWIKGR